MAEIAVLHLLFSLLQWSISALLWLARTLLRAILGLLDLTRSLLEIAAWSIGALDHPSSPAPLPNARPRVHSAWR